MKQVQLSEFGNPAVLRLVETSIPQPRKGQVLIKVKSIGLNYSDVLRRRNTYFMPTPLPYVLGSEAVGEIVASGDEMLPPPFEKGQMVLAILPYGGAYAEYVVANGQYCVPLPPTIDPKEATAIFVQGSTAYLMMYQWAKEMVGKTILIHAAAGGVGSLLVQLGKLAGAKVIATASQVEKLKIAQQLGADLCINYSHESWTEELIQKNNGQKVDYIFKMVGGKIYEQSFNCLATCGTMIVYGAASGQKGFVHSEHFVDESHHISPFNLAHFIQYKTAEWQAALRAMIQLIAEKQIQVKIPNVYPLAEVQRAHRDIENRQTTGKVVLIP